MKRMLFAGLWLVVCVSSLQAAPVVFSGTGVNAAAITAVRDAFRTAIGGGTVAGANGSFGGVRREINWDGVPDALAAPGSLPGNFFNSTSPRGVVFSTAGSGFQVSANAGVAPVEFGNLNPGYTAQFAAFSTQRLFTALGSTVTDVNFFLPGTSTPALTSAFGVMFTDVDLANTTSLEFFDRFNAPLGKFFVPAIQGNETFSFLGVQFDTASVSHVRITSGNLALGIVNDTADLDGVAMDDFLYAEPIPTPESSSLLLTLAGVGLIGLLGFMRSSACRKADTLSVH